MGVLRRPFFIVAVLFGLDYLVWLWSLGGSRGAIGMAAGPLLVLLAAALLWLAIKEIARALASPSRRLRLGSVRRSTAGAPDAVRYRETQAATSATPESGESPGHDEDAPVVSGSSSSAQIAA